MKIEETSDTNPTGAGDRVQEHSTKPAVLSSPTSVSAGAFPDQQLEPLPLPAAAAAAASSAAETTLAASPWKVLPASKKSLRTTNPIRAIVDSIVSSPSSSPTIRTDGKEFLNLALGDPTAAGNLAPCPAVLDAIVDSVVNNPQHAAGYLPSVGLPAAVEAIAAHHDCPPDQVIVASGCSGALELALTALLDEDSILLVPQPGFPLYQVICDSHGASVWHYRLDPDCDWECDLDHLHKLMASKKGKQTVRGMILNNPSNPTGAVYTRQHLKQVLDFCHQYGLVVIADEVYGDLTWKRPFVPLAQVARDVNSQVPVMTCSGLAKQFLVPGWRVGWLVFQDNMHGSLQEVHAGAKRLSQLTLGASHLCQTAVAPALRPSAVTQQWKQDLVATLEQQASFMCRELETCPGLTVHWPAGAMYAMVFLNEDSAWDDSIQNGVDFCQGLLQEENVLVLPGSCFGVPRAFRVVFCAPIVPTLQVATARIRAFCQRHCTSSA